jgi:hypothetical protein
MKTYSLDLWTRVVEAVDRHVGTQKEVATLLGVSCTFINKLLRQRRETGSLAPKLRGRRRGAKVAEEQREPGSSPHHSYQLLLPLSTSSSPFFNSSSEVLHLMVF